MRGHGVDLRIRIVVVVVEEAAEAVRQPLERVGGGARLPGGIGQVDGLVTVFGGGWRASWSAISSSASSQVTRSNCAEPRGPDAPQGPHKAIGAVRPRAHGQPAVARGGGLVRRHARKLAVAQMQLKRAAAGQSMAQNAGVRVSAGKAARVCGLVCAPICGHVRSGAPSTAAPALCFRKRNRPAPPCRTAGRL